ncbi:MAG: hypothetical protein V1858_05435 [Candidatus Gottesmanbacteria bacterium]
MNFPKFSIILLVELFKMSTTLHEILVSMPDEIPRQIKDFYKDYPTTFYYKRVDPKDQINENHRLAVLDICTRISNAKNSGDVFLGALFGPMASGKGVVQCEIAKQYQGVKAFKQIIDEGRGSRYITNSNGDGCLKIEATLFTRLEEILSHVNQGDVALIDEVEFSPNTPDEIASVIKSLRQTGVHAVISGLDFDFTRTPWLSTTTVLENVEHSFVLAASCITKGCGAPASFTQRTRPDGTPAHADDPQIQLGSVADNYSSRCGLCHVVLPARKGIVV